LDENPAAKILNPIADILPALALGLVHHFSAEGSGSALRSNKSAHVFWPIDSIW